MGKIFMRRTLSREVNFPLIPCFPCVKTRVLFFGEFSYFFSRRRPVLLHEEINELKEISLRSSCCRRRRLLSPGGFASVFAARSHYSLFFFSCSFYSKSERNMSVTVGTSIIFILNLSFTPFRLSRGM